jgi:hypothetical protein
MTIDRGLSLNSFGCAKNPVSPLKKGNFNLRGKNWCCLAGLFIVRWCLFRPAPFWIP